MTPQNDPLLEQQRLLKINTRLRRIITCLSLILVVIAGLYIYNHLHEDLPGFIGQNPDGVANPNMHNYRRGIHFQHRSMGVYYPADSIRKFLDKIMPELEKDQKAYECHRPGNFNFAKYKWMVGFYWMMKKDASTPGSANKMDFYVCPTLVDSTDPHGILDYYDDDSLYYYHGKKSMVRYKGPALSSADNGNAFDEGQLWP